MLPHKRVAKASETNKPNIIIIPAAEYYLGISQASNNTL